jgi:hypothetical protein
MNRENILIVAMWAVAMLLLSASALRAADTYQHPPLQLLEDRVDEHDQQICELDTRLDRIEKLLEYKAGAAVPTRSQPAPKPSEVVTKVTPAAPAKANVRRLKTTSELRSEIARNRASRTYATISPATLSWARRHLQDHGYTASQVAGLNYSEAWQLHNLAHSPRKISPYASGASRSVAKRVDVFVPTPRTPTNNPTPQPRYTGGGGCPGGRCPTARSSSSRSSGWYPGKLLFGR